MHELTVQFKTGLYSKQPTWERISLENAKESIKGKVDPAALKQGEQAIWLTPQAHDSAGNNYFLPWLDVEDPDEHHSSIASNIRAAQTLFLKLDTFGLTQGMEILLSGKGLRFIWPFILGPEWKRAFKQFIADAHSFPQIDPSPFVGSNKWFRFLGYRGHSKQDSNPIDRHIHLLDKPDQIMELTENTYLELVQGKPDLQEQIQWFDRLLPRCSTLPDEWHAFLSEYDTIAKIKSNFVKLNWPTERPNTGINWDQIFDALNQKGIEHKEFQTGDTFIYKLSECPMCGRKDGNAWITQTGRLKCHHANSCRAGEIEKDPQDNFYRSGLHPSKWIDDYAGDAAEVKNQNCSSDSEITSIETARERIREAINSDGDKLILTDPGVGKTTTALEEAISKAETQLVLFTTVKHDNIDELHAKALELSNHLIEVRKIKGRSKENCKQIEFVDYAASKGFSPGLVCCSGCPYRDECEYQQQFKNFPKTGLIIACHEKAGTLPRTPDLWILDENPVKAFSQTYESGQGELTQIRSKLPKESGQVLDSIRNLGDSLLKHIQESEDIQARYYVQDPPAEWQGTETLWTMAGTNEDQKAHLSSDLGYFTKLSHENVRQWQRRLFYKEEINFNALQWLWTATGDEQGVAYLFGKSDRKHPIKYVLHRTQAPSMIRYNKNGKLIHKTQIIGLDGTGDPAELEALFTGRKFEDISANVKIPGRKIHLEYALGKESVVGNDKKKTPMKDEHIREKLKAGLQYLKPNEQKVLLVTYKNAKDKVVSIAQKLDPDREFVTTHFWGSRGLNKFEDCQAVICFGTPNINPGSIKDTANSLFSDIEDQKAWTLAQGYRETAQACHRIRPIYSEKSIVILGKKWPEKLGEPDLYIQDYQRGGSIDAAVERLKPIVQELGFITREIACIAGVFTGQDTKYISEWIEANKSLSDFSLFPKRNIYIGNRENSKGLSPIQLKGKWYWDQILDALKLELELPELKVQLAGTGRPNRGLGTIRAARRFYRQIGLPFSEESWQGLETLAPDSDIKHIKRRILPDINIAGAMDPKAVIDPENKVDPPPESMRMAYTFPGLEVTAECFM